MDALFTFFRDHQSEIWIEIGGGVFTSLLIFSFLVLILPRVRISEKIAHYTYPDGKRAFKVKIVNRSLWRAMDVKVELYLRTREGTRGGINIQRKKLKITPEQMWFIEAYRLRDRLKSIKKSKDDNYNAEYAVHLNSVEDLQKLWKDNQYTLEFRIIARHGLSGLARAFKQLYTTKTDIEEGNFGFGTNMDIIQQPSNGEKRQVEESASSFMNDSLGQN